MDARLAIRGATSASFPRFLKLCPTRYNLHLNHHTPTIPFTNLYRVWYVFGPSCLPFLVRVLSYDDEIEFDGEDDSRMAGEAWLVAIGDG